MDIQSERLVSMAREILSSHGFFVDNLWHINDILFLCEQKGMSPLSDAECMEVFALANERFDGEYGLCWPELERALALYMRHKEREAGDAPTPTEA